MILDAIIGVLVEIVLGIASLLPDDEPPAWLLGAGDTLSGLLGQFAALGAWAPVGLLVTVVQAVITAWLIGFAIKIIRIVVSFFTAGGGSAA